MTETYTTTKIHPVVEERRRKKSCKQNIKVYIEVIREEVFQRNVGSLFRSNKISHEIYQFI